MSTTERSSLLGQIAVISGGAGDIAGAIALELAGRGADIGVGDIVDESKVRPLMDQIRALGRRVRFDSVDVSNAANVSEWIDNVEADLGVPNLAIVNAATATFADIRTVTPEQWDREMRVNLNGAFYMAHACMLRLLHHAKPGRIVFIGSWVGHAPQTHIPAYCASKAGMRMLARCMARDLAADGILVNEVAPGNVDAGLTAQFFRDNPGEREVSANIIPVRSNMLAQDVAFQVAHLCDPRNLHMTGTTIVADGGLSLLSYPRAGERQ